MAPMPCVISFRFSKHLRVLDALLWCLILSQTLHFCPVSAQRPRPNPHGRNENPWDNYDNSVVVRTYYGDVRGFSVPMSIYDEYFDPKQHEQPLWFIRRVNVFLGIPYASPPLGHLRFKAPERPRWGGTWEARYYKPACPQDMEYLKVDIPKITYWNISEDCLYMNVFAPNRTAERGRLYPVLVWIHGGDFVAGSGQQQPGQVLATQDLVVVTFNYRLGALGFLSTEDEYGPGNWGMLDQVLALEFIKENIREFNGDPSKITIAGTGSGAASVGLHLVSPRSMEKDYYQQAMMMNGCELNPFAYVDSFWVPKDYGKQLATYLNCPTHDSWRMLECLRDNKTITWQAIRNAQNSIKAKNGELGQVWGPVLDGGYYRYFSFLPQSPLDLRNQEHFDKVRLLIGVNRNEGSQIADKTVLNLDNGMYKATFDRKIRQYLRDWRVKEEWLDRVFEAVEFRYTYWPEPENDTARTQMYLNFMSDSRFGAGMDGVVKSHAKHNTTYQYVFNHRSWWDNHPYWMGVSHQYDVQFAFGYPFTNETVLNESYVIPRQWYTERDRNVSEFMMWMITNYTHFGNPTVNVTYNITWIPFNFYNLSYLSIEEWPWIGYRFRQMKYAFWREYFPLLAQQNPIYYPSPTPAGQQYKYSTIGMGGAVVLMFVIMGVCVYLLVWQNRQIEERQQQESERRLEITPGSTPTSTLGRSNRMLMQTEI